LGHVKVFELLGLAVPEDKSPLNWRTSSDLVDLVAPFREPLEGGRHLTTDTEKEARHPIIGSALPMLWELPEKTAIYVQEVLAFIGLLKRADHGEWVPTQRLRKLAADRCLIPRGQPRYCKAYAGD
jgi:hypothetical protein